MEIPNKISSCRRARDIGIGNLCPKCYVWMRRKTHRLGWKPSRSKYHKAWDFCGKCGKIKKYDAFKFDAERPAQEETPSA